MADKYVSVEAAIEHFKQGDFIKGNTVCKYCSDTGGPCYCDICRVEELAESLRNIPPADVAPVVRCQHCRWWPKDSDADVEQCAMLQTNTSRNWFCGSGKRRN